MKKFLLTLAAAALVVGASARELQNADFNGAWLEATPWTPNPMNEVHGVRPDSWCISHVSGMFFPAKPDFPDTRDGYLGATVVGDSLNLGSGNYAVRLQNNPNPFMATQIVPAYLTLGTSWSTANGFLVITDKDGGTFGGVDFTDTPDAVAFNYRRAHAVGVPEGSESPVNMDEPASVIAYLWKGTYTQKNVPASISMDAPVKVDMVDRDRNILGMETATGAEVSTTDGASLIGRLNCSITGDAAEWTEFIQPIEYVGQGTPDKFNLIIAANDYFGAAETVGCGNTLDVDDVKLVYYSRIASVTINGTPLEGFDPDVFEYEIPMPESGDIGALFGDFKYTLLGHSAAAGAFAQEIDAEGNPIFKITVSNVGEDVDGLKEHTYTFRIVSEKEHPVEGTTYTGRISITMEDQTSVLENQDLIIFEETVDKGVMALYNFSLDGNTSIGDIVIENIAITQQNGVKHYAGEKKGLSLAYGMIVADVTCEGDLDAEGNLDMNINVMWEGIPIYVTFTNRTSGITAIGSENAGEAEYYHINGVKVSGDNLTPGLYIKVQGARVTKLIVK